MVELENYMVIDSLWPAEQEVAFKCENCYGEIYKYEVDCLVDDNGNHFCGRKCADEYYGIHEEEWEESDEGY